MVVTVVMEVTVEDSEGQEERHVFHGVLVCSGHYTHPVSPLKDFPGPLLVPHTPLSACLFDEEACGV